MPETAQNVIDDLAHTRVEDCYQCGKCTAGCPVAEWMDLVPNQVMRLAQSGNLERVTKSAAIWLCVSCHTCGERCPKSLDVATVMDAFRQLSAERGDVDERVRRTVTFQRAFLDSIRKNGRLNELEMIRNFKTKAFVGDASVPLLFQDAMLAPRMMARGKLYFRGRRVNDRDIVKRIFDRCTKQD